MYSFYFTFWLNLKQPSCRIIINSNVNFKWDFNPGDLHVKKIYAHWEIRKKTFLQERALFTEMLIYLLMLKEEWKDSCSGDYWRGWLPSAPQHRWENENCTLVLEYKYYNIQWVPSLKRIILYTIFKGDYKRAYI